MTNSHEIIAAFVDHERVDAAQLAQALAEPEGRQYLIDLLALREIVEEQTPVAAREIERPTLALRWPWLSIAAAVLVIATLASGYAAGLRQGVLHPSGGDVQAGAPRTSAPMPAPAPTQVIRLQNGVDWQEQIGGH
jgi:hypothetical protein